MSADAKNDAFWLGFLLTGLAAMTSGHHFLGFFMLGHSAGFAFRGLAQKAWGSA
jgi:hypothetical protein